MKNILFLIILFALIGCKQYQSKTVKTINPVENHRLSDSINHIDSLQIFWKDFRKAIMQEDSLRLIELTNFPLNSHGQLDDDPQIMIEKDNFYRYLKICLKEPTGMTLENETNLDYIKRTNRLINDRYFILHDNWCRVSSLEFEKINGDWKLTLIYFDTRQLEE